MRIVFFGSGEFGLPTLKALCRDHHVQLVITQPDRPAGRKRIPTPTPIGVWAASENLPIIKPQKVNEGSILEKIRDARADAHIVVAFGQKIGDEIIAAPSHGHIATMNLHASLLPKYRGAAPINWAMIHGETTTGNTVFSLVDRMDAGDILATQETPIDPNETAGELHDRLSILGPQIILETLDDLEQGQLKGQPQDHSLATIAPKLSKADGMIDFTQPALQIRQRIHGLTPWPGVTMQFHPNPHTTQDSIPVKILRVSNVDTTPQSSHSPGQIIDPTVGIMACGKGALQILEIQPAGKNAMKWSEFANGYHPTANAYLKQT